MATARMRVTPELFCDIMHLPEGTKIITAHMDAFGRDIEFIIEHKDAIPDERGYVTPHFVTHTTMHDEVEFIGWQWK